MKEQDKNLQDQINEEEIGNLPEKKGINYLGINLPKETKDLYAENYKTLKKKLKKIGRAHV